jgi:hypothetical protein
MAFSGEYMVPIQDAQKLERELAEVTKQRDALAEALEKAKIAEMQLENADINLEQCRLNFVGRIKKLEQERDALAFSMRFALANGLADGKSETKLRQALAATKGESHE